MGRPRKYYSDVSRAEAKKQQNKEAAKRYHLKKRQERAGLEEKKRLFSARIRATIIGRLQRLTQEALATGRYPYKSLSDTLEDLILRGFKTLAGDEGLVDDFLPQIEVMQQFDTIERNRRESHAMVNKAKMEIGELMAIQAHDAAVHYYHTIYEAITRMNATVWRNWALAQLEKHFPLLHQEQVKAISLKTDRPNLPGARGHEKKSAPKRKKFLD